MKKPSRWIAPFLAFILMSVLEPCPILAAESVACNKPAHVLSEESGPDFKEFLKFLKANPTQYGTWGLSQDVVDNLSSGYVADINNDGVKEYVVTFSEGSGAWYSVLAFQKKGNQFVFLEGPNKPETIQYDGPWFHFLHEEFLVELCGKIYMNFSEGRLTALTRESYIWQNGVTTPACNKEWVEYERKGFQNLYHSKKYKSAQVYLDSIVQTCSSAIQKSASQEPGPATATLLDPDQAAWIESDLAIVAYQMGKLDSCLAHIKNGRALLKSTSDKKIKPALDFNEKKCVAPATAK